MSTRSAAVSAVELLVLAGYAAWLLAHPSSLPSDDALFFVRAVDHFSVVELSPHFPGYPAFVIAARALNVLLGDPARAVLAVGALSALSIPVSLYAWARRAGASLELACAAAACALFQPSLPGVALSMLSDPLGIALALWCLVALQSGRFLDAGLLMGLCIAARPSYGVLALAVFACLALLRRDALRPFALVFAGVGIAATAFVLGADGLAYFEEGRRFVAGHFAIWGRGAFAGAERGWGRDLLDLAGGRFGAGAGAAVLALVARFVPARELGTACALAMLLAYATWIVWAQNPDSARHAIPLVFLALGLAVTGAARLRSAALQSVLAGLLLAAALHGFVGSVDLGREPSPLERASRALDAHPDAVLITQWGIEVMRARHPELRIFDAYYGPSTRLAARTTSHREILRISTTQPGAQWRVVAELPARFPGEKGLLLSEWKAGAEGSADGLDIRTAGRDGPARSAHEATAHVRDPRREPGTDGVQERGGDP